jgi:hypothetical protein
VLPRFGSKTWRPRPNIRASSDRRHRGAVDHRLVGRRLVDRQALVDRRVLADRRLVDRRRVLATDAPGHRFFPR